MTADGATHGALTIVIGLDPRTNGSTPICSAQFALATEIRDKMTAANEAVLRIRHLGDR